MRYTKEECLQIASTIWEQMGANRFKAMTSAHSLFYINTGDMPGLQLDFKGSRKASRLRVLLTPMDEYNMVFYRRRNGEWKEVEKHEGVYCDMLQELFTEFTGLDTHL